MSTVVVESPESQVRQSSWAALSFNNVQEAIGVAPPLRSSLREAHMTPRQRIFHDYLDEKVPAASRWGRLEGQELCRVTPSFNARYADDEVVEILDKWRLPQVVRSAGPNGVVIVGAAS